MAFESVLPDENKEIEYLRKREPIVTIGMTGTLTFNKFLCRKLGLDSYSFCELFYNKSERKMKIIFLTADNDSGKCHRIFFRERQGFSTLCIKSVLGNLGISTPPHAMILKYKIDTPESVVVNFEKLKNIIIPTE